MNGSMQDDPLEELRRSDPVPADQLPPASLARVRVRVFEDVAAMTKHHQPGQWRKMRIAAGGLVAALVVAIVVIAVPRGPTPGLVVPPPTTGPTPGLVVPPPATGPTPGLVVPPTTGPSLSITPSDLTGPGAASCVEQYTRETLARRGIAFDGTVTAIAGDEVTFRVNVPYRGVSSGSVTLTTTGMTGTTITSAGGPTLSIGERYLVAGEDSFAWACGFTQPYDAPVAATWAAVFGR